MNEYQTAYAIILLTLFGLFTGWWINRKHKAKIKKRNHLKE